MIAASRPFPLPALTVHESPQVQRRKAHYVCATREGNRRSSEDFENSSELPGLSAETKIFQFAVDQSRREPEALRR